MDVKDVLIELDNQCNELINANNSNFNGKKYKNIFFKIIQCFNYIKLKTSLNDMEYIKAVGCIRKLEEKVSSLDGAFSGILFETMESQIDLDQLGQVESKKFASLINNLACEYMEEINNGYSLDSINEYEFNFNQCRELLISSKEQVIKELSLGEYLRLLDTINAYLKNIKVFSKVLNVNNKQRLNKGYTKIGILAFLTGIVTIGIMVLGTLLR